MFAKLALCLVVAVVPVAGVMVDSPSGANAAAECSFSRGVTTCVTTTQSTVTEQRTVFSGCAAGPTGVPGRRTTVFEDTVLVTETITTLAHGRDGPVFQSTTATTREIQSSVELSSVCEPI